MRSLRAAPRTTLTGRSCHVHRDTGLSPRGARCLANRAIGCDSRLVHRTDARSSRLASFLCAWPNLVGHSVWAGEAGGSIPSAQTFPPPPSSHLRSFRSRLASSSLRPPGRFFCAWLNLAERSVRVGKTGGSNPPAQTTYLDTYRRSPTWQRLQSQKLCSEGSNPFVGTNVPIADSDAGRDSSPWWKWHTRQLEMLCPSGR